MVDIQVRIAIKLSNTVKIFFFGSRKRETQIENLSEVLDAAEENTSAKGMLKGKGTCDFVCGRHQDLSNKG